MEQRLLTCNCVLPNVLLTTFRGPRVALDPRSLTKEGIAPDDL